MQAAKATALSAVLLHIAYLWPQLRLSILSCDTELQCLLHLQQQQQQQQQWMPAQQPAYAAHSGSQSSSWWQQSQQQQQQPRQQPQQQSRQQLQQQQMQSQQVAKAELQALVQQLTPQQREHLSKMPQDKRMHFFTSLRNQMAWAQQQQQPQGKWQQPLGLQQAGSGHMRQPGSSSQPQVCCNEDTLLLHATVHVLLHN